jgi:O-antigen/teichoic acid export membrane protein
MVVAIMALVTAASAALMAVSFSLRNTLDWIIVFVLVSVGPTTLFSLGRSTLRGQFDRKREIGAAFLAIIAEGVCVALTVLILATPRSPIIGAVIADLVIAGGALAYFIHRKPAWWHPARLRACFTSPGFRDLLALAAPIWIADVMAIIGHQADQFIVTGQLGYLPMAEYAAALTFVGLLNQPISVLARIFIVTFASGFYLDVDKYRRASSLNMAFISTLGLAVTVVSVPLTPIVFTDEYRLAPTLAAILSIAFVFKAVEVLNTALTIARDYPAANRDSKVWSTVLYVPLAFVFVAQWGVIGAAWSNVLSWGAYALIHAAYMGRRLPEHAAHTYRETILGTVLYGLVIGLMLGLKLGWAGLILIPLYLVAGHVIRLWDLNETPGLLRRLLPARLVEAFGKLELKGLS